jgi:hypothetical protein
MERMSGIRILIIAIVNGWIIVIVMVCDRLPAMIVPRIIRIVGDLRSVLEGQSRSMAQRIHLDVATHDLVH